MPENNTIKSKVWMPIYWADWTRDTSHLSLEEQGAYMALVREYWNNWGRLPDDINKLYRRVGAQKRSEKRSINLILLSFFKHDSDGFYSHKRIDDEIAKSSEKRDKASLSAKSRWNKSDADAYANASPKHMLGACSSPSPSPSPSESKKEERKETKAKKELAVKPPLVLPDWLPLKDWEDFLEMRRKIKKPATDIAERLLIGKLDALRKKGHSPAAVLQKSIVNCWQDVFEPKEPPEPKRVSVTDPDYAEKARKIYGE